MTWHILAHDTTCFCKSNDSFIGVTQFDHLCTFFFVCDVIISNGFNVRVRTCVWERESVCVRAHTRVCTRVHVYMLTQITSSCEGFLFWVSACQHQSSQRCVTVRQYIPWHMWHMYKNSTYTETSAKHTQPIRLCLVENVISGCNCYMCCLVLIIALEVYYLSLRLKIVEYIKSIFWPLG